MPEYDKPEYGNFGPGRGGGNVLYRPGVVATVGSWLGVSVDGSVITARWADPLVLQVGDPVLVLMLANGAYGQSEGIVLCRLTNTPRPSTGKVTVVPTSSATISVLGADGVTYTATFAYTSPAVNDQVILSWNAAVPTALAKVTSTPAQAIPVAPVAPPSGPASSGTSYYPASDSATYSPYGWDAWGGGGGNVYQGGAAYGGPTYGAWFYNGAAAELAGRTINRIQFRLGSRRRVGSYNSPATVNVYAHTSGTRPGGDVSRASGPSGITAQPGQGSTMYDLPLSFAATLQAGGGISIAGEPYAGFQGRYAEPDSGTLQIDWSR